MSQTSRQNPHWILFAFVAYILSLCRCTANGVCACKCVCVYMCEWGGETMTVKQSKWESSYGLNLNLTHLQVTDQQTPVAAPTYTLMAFNTHIWSAEKLIKDFQFPSSKVILNIRHQAVSMMDIPPKPQLHKTAWTPDMTFDLKCSSMASVNAFYSSLKYYTAFK